MRVSFGYTSGENGIQVFLPLELFVKIQSHMVGRRVCYKAVQRTNAELWHELVFRFVLYPRASRRKRGRSCVLLTVFTVLQLAGSYISLECVLYVLYLPSDNGADSDKAIDWQTKQSAANLHKEIRCKTKRTKHVEISSYYPILHSEKKHSDRHNKVTRLYVSTSFTYYFSWVHIRQMSWRISTKLHRAQPKLAACLQHTTVKDSTLRLQYVVHRQQHITLSLFRDIHYNITRHDKAK